MQSLRQVMGPYMTGRISDSDDDVINKYICNGCQAEVKVRILTHSGGPLKGKEFESHTGCKCEDMRLAREVFAEHEKRKVVHMFNDNSLINPNLQNVSFDDYIPKNESTEQAKVKAMEYADTFDKDIPKNILFSGAYGLGKSHLGVSIAKTLMSNGFACIFISVPKLLTKIKATYNKKSGHTEDELMSALEKVDCLILDDIGAEQSKKQDEGESWAVSKLFEIIDSRCGKHTVYTTNLNSKELPDRIGPRSFSRMMQDTEIIKMTGNDFRLKDF